MKKVAVVLFVALIAVGCSQGPTIPEDVTIACPVTVSGSYLVLERAGFVQSYESFEGERVFTDDLGVDWAVIEECNAVALYTMQADEVVSYLFFAPEGFPLKDVYKEPWMGAKNLLVLTEPGHRLILQVGGERIGF